MTLTGVNDSPAVADGNQPYTVTLTVNQGSTADPIYDALSAVTVYAVNADNEYGLDLGPVTGQATEAGGTATFPVALLTQPASAVTVIGDEPGYERGHGVPIVPHLHADDLEHEPAGDGDRRRRPDRRR